MPRMGTRLIAAFTVAITFAVAAPASHARENFRITIPVPAFNYYSIYAARDLGYFEDEGIEMEIVVTQGDGPDVDALIAGSVQFTATTPNRLLTAYQQGKPLLGVLSLFNRVGINCFINNESAAEAGIQEDTPLEEKFSELEGMTIGGTRPGSFTYLLAINYLQRAGLVPQEDAQVIGVGGGPSMLAAVENRQIDVGCLASPTPEIAVSRGESTMLVNNTLGWDEEYDEFLFSVLYVRPDYAAENPEAVKKVIRALQRAMTYIVETPFDEQRALLEATFGPIEEDVLRESLANNQAAINPTGEITERAFQAAVEFLVSTGAIGGPVEYDAVINNSYQTK